MTVPVAPVPPPPLRLMVGLAYQLKPRPPFVMLTAVTAPPETMAVPVALTPPAGAAMVTVKLPV